MATLGSNIIVAGGGDGHVKYTDAEAVAAVHTKYTDAEAIAAVEGEATLDLAGDVDVATGKTLSADGLEFPATQVASAGVNTLDDYEEGSFTPSIGDNGLDGSGEGQGYTTQVGRYTKIGNRVYFNLTVLISDLGTLTTTEAMRVLGLPFTSNSTSGTDASFVIGTGVSLVLNNAGECISGFLFANVSNFRVSIWDITGGATTMLISGLSAGGELTVSGTYMV